MNHTDIKKNGWITAFLPEKMQPYALLARLDRPIGIWLLLLPAWWGIALAIGGGLKVNANDAGLLFLFAVGAVVMRAAGCVVNDLWDRQIDAQVERTKGRPIASGEISPRRGFIFLCALLLIGLYILMQLSLVPVLLGFVALPLIVLYPLMKRITWWPQLFLGIVFNFGALMGWAAATGILELSALFLYAGGIFWTLGYDTIYAHQDKEDDLRAGIKSTALKLGEGSLRWVKGFYILAFIFIVLAFIFAQAGLVSLAALLCGGAHLLWQVKDWDLNDPKNCLRIFKSNRDFGLLILLAALL